MRRSTDGLLSLAVGHPGAAAMLRLVTFAYKPRRREPRCARVLRLLLACLLAVPVLHTSLAHAAPAAAAADPTTTSTDPLLQLLKDRGVLPAAAAAVKPVTDLALQVRDRAAEAVVAAMAFLDLPYARGGTSAQSGFDCSGFTRHVFQHTVGLLLPRSAEQQARDAQLLDVSAEELKPGDLVFFNTMKRAFSHVGIYVGNGRFVHAPREGAVVRVENMQIAYWARNFNGARRVPAVAETTTAPSPVASH